MGRVFPWDRSTRHLPREVGLSTQALPPWPGSPLGRWARVGPGSQPAPPRLTPPAPRPPPLPWEAAPGAEPGPLPPQCCPNPPRPGAGKALRCPGGGGRAGELRSGEGLAGGALELHSGPPPALPVSCSRVSTRPPCHEGARQGFRGCGAEKGRLLMGRLHVARLDWAVGGCTYPGRSTLWVRWGQVPLEPWGGGGPMGAH